MTPGVLKTRAKPKSARRALFSLSMSTLSYVGEREGKEKEVGMDIPLSNLRGRIPPNAGR